MAQAQQNEVKTAPHTPAMAAEKEAPKKKSNGFVIARNRNIDCRPAFAGFGHGYNHC